MLTSLKRVIKFGWQGFARNKGLALQVIFIMGVAVFLIASFVLAKGASEFLMSEIQKRVDLAVYFKKEATEEDVLKVKNELSQLTEGIQSIDYVSKEKAQEFFEEEHKDDYLWLEALEELEGNPFPASLNIKAASPVFYAEISSFLEESASADLIGRISYNQEKNKRAIQRLFDLGAALKIGSIVLISLVGVLIVLITSNIIKLTIIARKGELSTMRLVGASRWFLKGPLLLQSVFYGLFAVLAVDLLLFAGLYLFDASIKTWLLQFDLLEYFQASFLVLFLLQLAFVVLLGIFSILIAVRKYAKV